MKHCILIFIICISSFNLKLVDVCLNNEDNCLLNSKRKDKIIFDKEGENYHKEQFNTNPSLLDFLKQAYLNMFHSYNQQLLKYIDGLSYILETISKVYHNAENKQDNVENYINENITLNEFTSNGTNDFYNTSGDNAELVYPVGFGQKDDFNFSTNLPVFSNTEAGYNAFKKYLATGDYSGAENANELKYGNLYLDIYIDGNTRPNITVGLTCDKNADSDDNPYYGTIAVDVYFANVIKDNVIKKPVTIGQSFNFSFDSAVSSASLEWYDKITYNVNKLFDDCGVTITGFVYSNNEETSIANAAASVTYKSNTSTKYENNLIVRFHTDGENAENDGYMNPNAPSDNDSGETTIDTVGLLTTTYVLTQERLTNIANKLWDSSFIDNIKLVNNNPIENVCSVKMLPVKVSGEEKEVYIGNVNFGINGEKISTNYAPWYSERKTISLKSDLPVWANYAPFTKLSIYLPYIGYIE